MTDRQPIEKPESRKAKRPYKTTKLKKLRHMSEVTKKSGRSWDRAPEWNSMS